MKDVFTYTKHNQWLLIYTAAAQTSASQLKNRHWPALRSHRDRRCWRRGRRSSWQGPTRTPWQPANQHVRRTRQEEGEEVRSLDRSFSLHALSLVDPYGDLRRAGIRSSHRNHGNHLLKNEPEIRKVRKRENNPSKFFWKILKSVEPIT